MLLLAVREPRAPPSLLVANLKHLPTNTHLLPYGMTVPACASLARTLQGAVNRASYVLLLARGGGR